MREIVAACGYLVSGTFMAFSLHSAVTSGFATEKYGETCTGARASPFAFVGSSKVDLWTRSYWFPHPFPRCGRTGRDTSYTGAIPHSVSRSLDSHTFSLPLCCSSFTLHCPEHRPCASIDSWLPPTEEDNFYWQCVTPAPL